MVIKSLKIKKKTGFCDPRQFSEGQLVYSLKITSVGLPHSLFALSALCGVLLLSAPPVNVHFTVEPFVYQERVGLPPASARPAVYVDRIHTTIFQS